MKDDRLIGLLEDLFSDRPPPPAEGTEEAESGPAPQVESVLGEEVPLSPEDWPPELMPNPPSLADVLAASQDVPAWREELINGLLRILMVVGGLALLVGLYFAFGRQDLWAIPLYLGMYGLLALITMWKRLPYTIRVEGLLFLLYAVGIVDLLLVGKAGELRLLLLTLPILATLFFGWRGGGISLALAGLTMIGFGWVFSAGYLVAPLERQASSTNPFSWLGNTAFLLLLGSLMAVSLAYVTDYVIPRLRGALDRSRSLTSDLEEHRDGLLERAGVLKRKALNLEISTEVGRAVTSILDTNQLLHEAVTLIHTRFGWHRAAIFLLDDSGQRLHLAASAAALEAQVPSEVQALSVGETSLVGQAARHRRPRVASHLAKHPARHPYPLLPRTASEVALPLVVDGRLLGVLDIESKESEAFDAIDVRVLQGLADQVAIAIQTARKFQEKTASLATESPISRKSTSDGRGSRERGAG
jgi:hypothetical protein